MLGSGLPKIYRNWAGQHWRRPILYEVREPEQTLMELRMSSLVPPEVVQDLHARLGERLQELPELARLALITAATEGSVSNSRLREISTEHPADITKVLGSLVKDGLLQQAGIGRGMVYFTPWHASSLFEPLPLTSGQTLPPQPLPPELLKLPQELGPKPPELVPEPPELRNSKVAYLDWDDVPVELRKHLRACARTISDTKRAKPEAIKNIVLQLCDGRYLGRRILADLLHRNSDDLLKRILNPMVAEGQLSTAHPSVSDPRQAYTKAGV